jgi:hypothetical protein
LAHSLLACFGPINPVYILWICLLSSK